MTRFAVVGAATATIGFCLPIASANAAVGGVRVGGLHFGPLNATSTGQAGYFDLTPPATGSAVAKFTVPTITGCTATESGIALGNLIFTGSGSTANASGALVFAGCDSGSPFYEGVVVVNGVATVSSFTPAPGDKIKAKTKESATAASAKLTDITQAKNTSASATSGAVNSAILDGIDSLVDTSSGAQLAVPNFGIANFSTGKMDGLTVGAAGATAYDMNATGSQVQITTSALTGGKAWTETFVHS
jgi:hypothetical protein